MKEIFKSIHFVVCLFSFYTFSLQAEIVTRAALDVGSAETKLTVADVDTETNKIVHTWHKSYKNVELRKDLAASSDSCLSERIEKKLIDTLKEMKEATGQFATQEWVAVGTSVFRKAKNGQEFLDRIKIETGISIRLISQMEEGEIGFLSAVAASRLNQEDVIVWDSGSGSFQISSLIDDRIEVYGAEFAFVPALEALFKNRGQPFSPDQSPNPVTVSETFDLVHSIRDNLPPIPSWLDEKNKQVISLGGKTSIFSLAEIAIGQSSYTKKQVWEAIIELCGKTDEQLSNFPEPKKTVIELILLYSVMDHCDLKSNVSYFPTNGCCEGILITPRYWK